MFRSVINCHTQRHLKIVRNIHEHNCLSHFSLAIQFQRCLQVQVPTNVQTKYNTIHKSNIYLPMHNYVHESLPFVHPYIVIFVTAYSFHSCIVAASLVLFLYCAHCVCGCCIVPQSASFSSLEFFCSLILGACSLMCIASVISMRLGSRFECMMFVFSTSCCRVSVMLCLFRMCSLIVPDCLCIVNLLERVVQV